MGRHEACSILAQFDVALVAVAVVLLEMVR